MTKITVLNNEEKEGKKELKPIEFKWFISLDSGMSSKAITDPKVWKFIDVIWRSKRYPDNMDIFMCYDDPSEIKGLYLGFYNDGVV